MAATAPFDRPRDWFMRAAGVGKTAILLATGAALLSSALATGTASWALYEARQAPRRVERYVVYVGPGTQPVSVDLVGTDWSPRAGAWADFAARWVRYLRARPLDVPTLRFQRQEVIWSTDQRVWPLLRESMTAADEALRSTAVDVLGVGANLRESTPSHAVVSVEWSETFRNEGEARVYTALLTLALKPPETRAELDQNPLGLFVTSFQISRVR